MKEQKKAKASWCSKHLSRLHEDDNLLGVGLGLKETNGQVTETLAVKFYVRTKRESGFDRGEKLPAEIDSVPTDVVKMAPLRARGSFVQKVRPALGGCSGCVVVPNLNYTGTLGIAMRGHAGLADRTFIVSNNHVLANENQSHVGDAVIQPGTLDGGDPVDDRIGSLFDYVPLQFETPGQPPPVNRVDAACAEVDNFGDFNREIFWVGYPTAWRSRASITDRFNDGQTQVQKTGRTTGYTIGNISALNFDGFVGYSSGNAFFEDQLLIEPGDFSDAGDSGSAILDMDEALVGLLFAGGATHTVANYIEDVWQLLGPIDFSDGLI